MVKVPNPATHHNIVAPTLLRKGRCAIRIAMLAAPIAGELRKSPSPKVRSSEFHAHKPEAEPPPAEQHPNRSSEIDPRTILRSRI